MRLGADYYPEHWPESRWEEDAVLMQKAGLSVVRLAEFAWSRLEPKEDDFRLEWLEKAMDILGGHGISVVLGTPTAAPPAWLAAKHPEILTVDDRGYRRGIGTRVHRCYSSPELRKRSRAITEAMSAGLGKHEHLIGWQTDNEFSRNDCTCYACTQSWQEWLRQKYATLDALNAAWGTVFWSQEYGEWSEIPALIQPQCGTGSHNPSLILDWRRFQSQSAVAFQREQVEIIRTNSPDRFVTHNFMGFHSSLDYYELAKDLDIVSWDNYPSTGSTGEAHDLMRGLKEKAFWVMEERSGHMGWMTMSSSPRPGEIRLWAWEAIGHGADAVVFFRWRSCLYGTEQYWQGILNHDGVPRRRYREIARTAEEVRTLEKVLDDSTVANDIAVFNDYENIWALEIQPQTDGFSYHGIQQTYMKVLGRLGAGFDVVGPASDFTKYKLVIFPPLYVVSDALAEKIEAYVKGGGVAILSPRSGVKDETNACRTSVLPGPLAAIAGVEVSDYDAIGKDTVDIELRDGTRLCASVWCDVLTTSTAEAIAIYRSRYYRGEVAITVNKAGDGRAYYVGTLPEVSLYTTLLTPLLDELGVERVAGLPEGVGVARRLKEGKPVLFVFNFSEEPKEVALSGSRRDLLSREKEEGVLQLEPFGVRIFAI
jgi:beta-galactosidase